MGIAVSSLEDSTTNRMGEMGECSCSEAFVGMFSIKKVFLKNSQNSEENTCARASFLLKLPAEARYFPVNFAKLLRTTFFIECLWLLLLVVATKHFKNSFSNNLHHQIFFFSHVCILHLYPPTIDILQQSISFNDRQPF